MASAFDSAAFSSSAFDSYTLDVNSFYAFNGQKRFQQKRPIEELVFSVDFTQILGVGELIESVQWMVIPVGHTEDTSSMISGPSVLKDNISMQLIVGGTPDKSYVAVCAATTSKNQVVTLPSVGKGIFTVSGE